MVKCLDLKLKWPIKLNNAINGLIPLFNPINRKLYIVDNIIKDGVKICKQNKL